MNVHVVAIDRAIQEAGGGEVGHGWRQRQKLTPHRASAVAEQKTGSLLRAVVASCPASIRPCTSTSEAEYGWAAPRQSRELPSNP